MSEDDLRAQELARRKAITIESLETKLNATISERCDLLERETQLRAAITIMKEDDE